MDKVLEMYTFLIKYLDTELCNDKQLVLDTVKRLLKSKLEKDIEERFFSLKPHDLLELIKIIELDIARDRKILQHKSSNQDNKPKCQKTQSKKNT